MRLLIWVAAVAIVSLLFPLVTKKLRKSFADDIALSLQKAHLGKLPQGQYAGQRVYTKNFSRDALRVPLDADTLQRMAQCKTIHHHEVQCVGIGCKMQAMEDRAAAEVSVTVHFEGEMPDGQVVTVDVQDCRLRAEFAIHEIHGWTLTSLFPIQQQRSEET